MLVPTATPRLFLTLLACLWFLPANVFAAQPLTVHKSPTCGCCELWLDQLSEQDYKVAISHPSDLNATKQQLGIAPRYQSCHTAVTEQGFVFEGHIPEFLMRRFLAEPPPSAIGLTVPGMPVGSPGMEMGERFDPYQVLLLMADGSSRVYATINSPEQQHGR